MEAPAATTEKVHRRPLRRRRFGVWIALALVVAGAVAAWRAIKARGQEPIPVRTVTVQRGPVRDFVTSIAAGRVVAKQEIALRAEIAGKVLVLHHKRGEKVRAGEPLVTYDTEELRERVRLADSAIALARAQTSQAQESAATAEGNAARARKLRESGSIAPAEVESLEGQAATLARGTDAARAAVAQAAASAELARTALGKAVVRAPFTGTVLGTTIDAGEITTPGAPMLQLADLSELHVEADVDEADVGRVKVGLPADVSLDALPSERIRGRVRAIAPSVVRDPRGGRSVAVEIALPDDPRLMVGMSADVDVIVATRESALFVPPVAVQGRGAERAVFVVSGEVVQRRLIDVGISTWEAVEVKGGVTEGEEIVTSLATAPVSDGSRVRVERK